MSQYKPNIDFVSHYRKSPHCTDVESEAAYLKKGDPKKVPTWIYDKKAKLLKAWDPEEKKFIKVKTWNQE